MNGKMSLPLANGREYTVFGGPYRKRPAEINGHETLGVKMAVEIAEDCDVDIPVHDFSVPDLEDLDDGLLETVRAIRTGQPVYIGCMGGIGRTGLMLAILAKAWGINNPVQYVRDTYLSKAVETAEQKLFVAKYVVPPEVQSAIWWARFWSWFSWSKNMTKGA